MDEFLSHLDRLHSQGESFAVATVVAVRGSASAKPGSKAIINSEGVNVWGWVGGGCAESFVAEQALEAMKERQARMIQADLDDEIFGLGMPCGGVMDVFIEPLAPAIGLSLNVSSENQEFAQFLAKRSGFHPIFTASARVESREELLVHLSESIASLRGRNFDHLRNTKGYPLRVTPDFTEFEDEILIVGSSRITEELALFSALIGWQTRVYGWNFDRRHYPNDVAITESEAGFSNFHVSKGCAVIVASHHKGDPEFIEQALNASASYVGLVASEKRSRLVFESLLEGSSRFLSCGPEDVEKVFAPSGLDMNCQNPSEIALSCLAEIIRLKQSALHKH